MSTKTLGWLVEARDGKKLGPGIPTLSKLFTTETPMRAL